MILEEFLARVEDSPGIGILVAIEEPGPVLDLSLRHHRIESRPRIDVATDERGLAVRMLQQHGHDVLLGQPHRLQRAHQKDVRVGAACHRDALALEIGDLGDRRILARHKRRPLGAGIDVDRLDRVAVDLADEGGGAGRRAQVDRAGAEKFERLVGAERLHPHDGYAILAELLLQELFLLQHHRHRIIGRPVDADLLRLVGGAEPRARQQGERERAGEKRTARKSGHDDLHAFEPRPRSRAGRPVDEGGIFCPPSAWRGGGPRALAAFVKRPQAACSNRR